MRQLRLLEYVCEGCQKVFFARPTYLPRKYCTASCYKQTKRPHTPDFAGVRPHKDRKIVDAALDMWKGDPLTTTICFFCKKEFTHRVNRRRVGQRFCGLECSRNYSRTVQNALFTKRS